MIEIYAGKTALQTLQQQGLSAAQFNTMLGASGGPKWFSLFGLDKYLFGEFFAGRSEPLHLIGSSAGAFRAACFAQQNPVAAISRLAQNYAETVYSAKATASEISDKARLLLDLLFAEHGAQEIIDNQVFKAHFIVARANGLVASEHKALQLTGLLTSYALNRINRKLLARQYQRVIFQSPTSSLNFSDPCQLPTERVNLSQDNIKPALLASGSIPMVMQGIADIPGCGNGMYRDGGIIDYHFDIKVHSAPNLVLYPHFDARPKAGWFDKKLKRRIRSENYDNIVLLCPSPAFVASLPYGKIPDRKDFTDMPAQPRIRYWKTVLAETERLAEQFDLVLRQQDISQIKPLQ